jgi:hypothetical protein
MKNISMIIGLVAITFVATGCATSNTANLQSQLDALEAKNAAQAGQIVALKKQVEPVGESTADKVKAGWDWTVAETVAAWNSNASVETRARLEKCWGDLKTSSK